MQIRNSKWRNYILFSLLLTITVVLFEIIPRYSEIFSMGLDIYNRAAETKEAENNTGLEKRYSEDNKNLKQQINSHISNYEETQKISSIIAFLDEAAYGKGVDIASIKPGKMIKKDNLWLQPLEVNLDSDYEGVYNFIRHLEKSSKVILIKELDYKPKEPVSDSLRIIANLEVYLNL